MDAAPPSQSQHHYSQIFLNPDNTPLAVFVEASIRNRPKVVRSLRNHGAEICVDPAEASIILVDPLTEEARSFVTNWGNDLDIVILDHAWVRKCLDAGRLLSASDAWGGCGNLEGMREEDYYKDDVEEGLDEFGPEPGPSKPSKGRHLSTELSTNATPSRRKSISSPRKRAPSPLLPAHLPTPPPTSNAVVPYPASQLSYDPKMYQITHNHPYNTSHPGNGVNFAQQQQQFPQYNTPTQFPPPSQLPPPSPGGQLVMSQPPPSSQADYASMMISQMMRDNPAQFMQFVQYAMQGMPQGTVPGQMPNMAPPPTQVNGAQGWNTMNQMGNGTTPQAWPQADTTNSYYSQPPPHSQVSQTSTSSSGADNMNSSSQSHTYSQPDTSFTSSSPSATSVQYDETVNNAASSKRQLRSSSRIKSLQDDSDSGRTRKRVRSSRRESTDILSASLTRNWAEPSPRQSVSDGRLASALDLLSTIFIGKDDSPMLFFVQVDIRSRMQIIQNVKKNGGRITAEMSDAKFIILSPKGASFNKLAKEVIALERHAILPSFVQACVDEGRLVSEDDYLVEEIRSPFSSRRKPAFLKMKGDSQEKVLPSTILLPKEGSRIPVPTPPASINVSKAKGRFKSEERDYMLQVVRWAYHQDISLPQIAIARHLHAMVPARSDTSWRTMMQHYKEEVQKIREEIASSATSKEEDKDKDNTSSSSILPVEVKEELIDEAELEESQELAVVGDAVENETAVEQSQTTSRTTSPINQPQQVVAETPSRERTDLEDELLTGINKLRGVAAKHVQDPESDLSKDLITVSCYMAIQQLPDSDEDEGAFWDAASKLQPCITASSWQTFYELKKDEILFLLREIMDESAKH